MRPIVIFLAVAGVAIIAWLVIARPTAKQPDTKLQAITISKHSDSFNTQVAAALAGYDKIREGFVAWDSAGASGNTAVFLSNLDAIKLDELKRDSSIYLTAQTFIDNAKADAQTINTEKGIRQQREAFNSLTDNVYQFLNTVKYDRQKLYLQECPMAFDDSKPGQWLSEGEEIRNPYLGLHHPGYGKSMLSCGETKKVLNADLPAAK